MPSRASTSAEFTSRAVSSKVLPLLLSRGLLLGMVPASLLASKLVNWKTRDLAECLSYPFLRAEK